LSFVIAGLTLGALVASCGSTSPDTSKYEGTWKYTSGTVTGMCGTMSAMQDLTGTSATLAKGTSSDLVLTVSPTCIINFNIKGVEAVAAPGQICTIEVAMVGSLMVTVDSWTLETTDGMTMTGALAGKTTIPVGGFMITCNVNGTGTLMKQ
jgi:hypothetical protein